MSKSFSFNSIIPRINSVTKTDAASRKKGRAFGSSSTSPARAPRTSIMSGNWVSTASALGLAAIVLGLGFYIYTINDSASTGFALKHQQNIIDELNETQKRLTVQQAALGSIVKVNDLASTAGMVPVTGEEFLVANQVSSR